MSKQVLIVMTSHTVLGSREEATGTYLPEVAHAYVVFEAAGWKIDFASVNGGRVPLYGIEDDEATRAFAHRDDVMGKLHASLPPERISADKYDAIYYAGGHGTMWDFPDNEKLSNIATQIYGRGGIVSAVCHGPAVLVNIESPSGDGYLVGGKKVAAFTRDEEIAVGLENEVPFFLHDKLQERGASLIPAANWQVNVVTDERLVTGQNPASATGVAEAVVASAQ